MSGVFARYRKLDTIGRGTYGEVSRVVPYSDTNLVYALKVVTWSNQAERDAARSEAALMSSLPRHKRLICCVEIFEDSDQLAMVLEYAPLGDLTSIIQVRHCIIVSVATCISLIFKLTTGADVQLMHL